MIGQAAASSWRAGVLMTAKYQRAPIDPRGSPLLQRRILRRLDVRDGGLTLAEFPVPLAED